jgi:hypothetical protein
LEKGWWKTGERRRIGMNISFGRRSRKEKQGMRMRGTRREG